MKGDAIFDSTGCYRYLLRRWWDEQLPTVGFIMLNPSRADATANDPTIRRCIGFAQLWGYGSLMVANLFAYRATQSKVLAGVADPIGPDNDRHLLALIDQSEQIILAWGDRGMLLNRSQAVLHLLFGKETHCLGQNKTGQPRHPLYIKKATQPTLFVSEQ
ncbi:MAG: DUF1643 domain-containing protein [Cyanophyceae cyanobacterium]